jgi:hypothetical protein
MMITRKKISIVFLLLLVVLIASRPVLAEEPFSGEPYRLNGQAMASVQTEAPVGPSSDSYNYTRSAKLSLESDESFLAAVGQTFSVKLAVEPGEGPINAVKASLAYSAENLKLVAVDGEGAPFSIIYDEQLGGNEMIITAMQPAPGISVKAEVATLYFIATEAGEARIDFKADSLVLANDGYGSDVLAAAQPLALPIVNY